jgi:hypothetical protein
LTGQNFGNDWNAWGNWWNTSGGTPAYDPKIIKWWSGQPDDDKLAKILQGDDLNFLNKLRGVDAPSTTKPAP